MVTDVLPFPEQGATEAPAEELPKYRYPEFASWSGERYLKKLLRQILPGALYRTWEIFADHQAIGNDCYLGVTRLAEIAGRHTRTMEKNLALFCARHLLIERAERKLFWSAEGQLQSRVVVVKDFSGLYALAYDYHEWLHDPAYVAPEREMLSLLQQEPQLVARVRRFENYRRLLFNHLPGPAVHPRAEDRWFTEYQPEQLVHPSQQEYGIKGAEPGRRDQNPAISLAEDLAKEMATDSQKRRNESAITYRLERDSLDSIDPSCFSFFEQKPALLRNPHPDTPEACALPPEQERVPHGDRPRTAEPETLQLSVPELAASFVAALANPFGDQNPKGSQTRLRTLLGGFCFISPAEALRCLVRAYVVSRDTQTIRAKYCSPDGQVNRMPLFCAMVQRFLEEPGQEWDYPWQKMEEELVADPCLARWWSKHQGQISLPARSAWVVSNTVQQKEEASETAEQERETVNRWQSHRRVYLSQTEAEREARAVLAHRVLRRLARMAVPIQGASVLWEHLTCGCPLYHRYKGREVCALCFPDSNWPEEVMALLHSIVDRTQEGGGCEAVAGYLSQSPQEERAIAGEEAQPFKNTVAGWAKREDAYAYAVRLLDEMTCNGYVVEVFLELTGECYQVVLRGADGELVCGTVEQVEYLIEQARHRLL